MIAGAPPGRSWYWPASVSQDEVVCMPGSLPIAPALLRDHLKLQQHQLVGAYQDLDQDPDFTDSLQQADNRQSFLPVTAESHGGAKNRVAL